mmetsp:Transcript_23167/g.68867  ORF Transcript_23167/g.68867 Transcript_23167/m.68867 type:complete len:317 (-) Transcript_23167:489-1439(-)
MTGGTKGMPPGFDTDKALRDRELFAVFREEASLANGDPYQPSNPTPDRYKGKQFGAPYQPKGSGHDAMIDKTTLLCVAGDTYLDPHMVDRALTRAMGQPISDKPFKPAAVPPKPPHAGSTVGMIGDPMLDTCPTMRAQTSANVKAESKRNLYVNPPKKGTYGFPDHDRTIGGTKLVYIPDMYAPAAALTRKMRAEARARFVKPFCASGRTGSGIVPTVNYMGGAGERRQRPMTTGSLRHDKPWRSAPPTVKGKGDYGCINKTVYIPQMSTPPARKELDKKPFHPPSCNHSRLSMWSVNKYAYEARPPVDNDMSLLK